MSTDPEFSEAIREAAAGLGQIFREAEERQRAEVHGKIRSLLEMARGRAGGELAEALLNVMLVTDRWHARAWPGEGEPTMIPALGAVDEILTAIETGLGARTS